MLGILKNNRAQAVMGEYVVVIFLVVTVIVTMTIYFKRAVQARIYESREYMISEVLERTGGDFEGRLDPEYEPYYTNTITTASSAISRITELEEGASSGIFTKTINDTRMIDSYSETAPPKDFELTTPTN